MQRIFKPSVPTISVSVQENAVLQQQRLEAQRDALRRLGWPDPRAPVRYDDVVTKLRVHERLPDGSLRASVFVHPAGQRHRYVRSLRVTTGEPASARTNVLLRVV